MSRGNFIVRRDGIWHFARRVPVSVAHFDKRIIVKQSTKIRVADDPRGVKARKVAERINSDVEAFWRGIGNDQAAEAQGKYEAARRRARTFGFEYVQALDLAHRSTSEILEWVQITKDGPDEPRNVAALLGGERPPSIMLAKLFDEYETLTSAARRDMSPDQVRKSNNPRRRAVANLIKVIGNRTLASITKDDALEFQDWWRARLTIAA